MDQSPFSRCFQIKFSRNYFVNNKLGEHKSILLLLIKILVRGQSTFMKTFMRFVDFFFWFDCVIMELIFSPKMCFDVTDNFLQNLNSTFTFDKMNRFELSLFRKKFIGAWNEKRKKQQKYIEFQRTSLNEYLIRIAKIFESKIWNINTEISEISQNGRLVNPRLVAFKYGAWVLQRYYD